MCTLRMLMDLKANARSGVDVGVRYVWMLIVRLALNVCNGIVTATEDRKKSEQNVVIKMLYHVP